MSARKSGRASKTKWRHSSPRSVVQAPVVRVAVPANEDHTEDLLSDRANAVVGITLPEKGLRVSSLAEFAFWRADRQATNLLTHVRRPPEFRDKAGVVVDGLRGPAELAEDFHVGQSGHLREQFDFWSQFSGLVSVLTLLSRTRGCDQV